MQFLYAYTHQWHGVVETLERAVHVARIAKVAQTNKTMDGWLPPRVALHPRRAQPSSLVISVVYSGLNVANR